MLELLNLKPQGKRSILIFTHHGSVYGELIRLTHAVGVLAQLEEVCLLLCVHAGAAAVGAAAILQLLSVQKDSQGVQYLPL